MEFPPSAVLKSQLGRPSMYVGWHFEEHYKHDYQKDYNVITIWTVTPWHDMACKKEEKIDHEGCFCMAG